MKKIAWPWIGTTEHEMGSMGPKGDFTDKEEGSQQPHDMLVPSKSLVEEQESSINYENGVMSPVEDVSFADDDNEDGSDEKLLNPIKKNNDYAKASVEVYEDQDLIANFSCNIASNFSDKMAGLQPYKFLPTTAGLIFEYKRAEDVLYHMGTVKFAIDILFVDDNDKIKRIYKDIQPGTLGTFGCSGVKNVLEICGGLSDRLGISVGNHISINKSRDSELDSVRTLNKQSRDLGIEKDVIVKYSSIGINGFTNWKGFPILNITDDFNKNASDTKLLSNLISKFQIDNKKRVYAFDFDGLIEESAPIRIYMTSQASEDKTPYLKIDGHAVSLNKSKDGADIYREVSAQDLRYQDLKPNESIISSLNKSYYGFLNSPEIIEDATKIFDEFRRASRDNNSNMVIVTRFSNPESLRDVICNRASLQAGESLYSNVIKISEESDAQDIILCLRKKFGNKDIKIFSDDSLLRRAGVPIPDEVKSTAKRIYKLLEAASLIAEKSLENMQKNVAAYQEIQSDPEKIKNTKGQYNQSVKNNTRIVREFLIKIRDSIRLFNQIKDISTTTEIIDSLTSSAKTASDAIEDIFDMVDQMESPDFHMVLSEKVKSYEKVIDDLQSSLDKGKDYINSDILGLVVISS